MQFLLIGLLLGALNPHDRPDVTDWTEVSRKELEFRVDDYRTAFVGAVTVYQNPKDKNEFVRVYTRQVAIVSQRAKELEGAEAKDRSRGHARTSYHKKQERETLERVQKSADPFAYVSWRTVRDERTGQDISAGDAWSWILESDGVWRGTCAHEGHALTQQPLSEPSKENPRKRVLVGFIFTQCGERTHVLRVDQDDLTAPKKQKDKKPAFAEASAGKGDGNAK